ncbi:acetate/propionate family kinase [Sphingobium yanoikuyae]|uniref:Acetate kinase n=1 Tax=Sphingobium yanoikuyae TaxID=13690 RepID=A0A9X7U4C9_SPHYA|nr:acetate/propionate family kinase [Sphingobium yanoikuyae]QNG43476.1 acetate/propionate family kinase [Sphingobium yanoikuyae]
MKAIVTLNAGSSSIKFALYELSADGLRFDAGGKIEEIGTAPRLRARDAKGEVILEHDWPQGDILSHEHLLDDLFAWAATQLGDREIVAIGHRIVHGGTAFAAPRPIDDALLDALADLIPLAPLHQPHNLAAVRALRTLAPHLPQIACFDTAFHHDLPQLATRLPLPRAFHDQGVRRYGFHGLSYEHIAARLRDADPERAGGRVIAAHLGNGASLCAMQEGKSVDTTMGFTALDGLMMGTRSGALDPGVVLHLQTQLGMSAKEVETLLYKKSGLLGVSGASSDMRTLHASGAPEATEAIELFVRQAARQAAALIPALGGLDGVVFTAGIGENDAVIRARICKSLAWTGLALDPDANGANAAVISARESKVLVRVIPTDEEAVIAHHVAGLIKSVGRSVP